MFSQSRDICTQLQDGLLKVTAELQTVRSLLQPPLKHLMWIEELWIMFVEKALKTYYQYYTEFMSAEGKLKEATKLEEKQKQSASKKMGRLIEKVYLPFIYQTIAI